MLIYVFFGNKIKHFTLSNYGNCYDDHSIAYLMTKIRTYEYTSELHSFEKYDFKVNFNPCRR